MKLRNELLKEHSKAHSQSLATFIGNDTMLFAELIEVFLCDEYRVTQRASHVLSECADRHPQLIAPYLKKLLLNLQNPVHNAVKRNTFRVLQDFDLPDDEEILSLAAEVGFATLQSNKEAVATKAFAMTVLGNVCKKVPELTQELKIIIEDQMPYGSPGFVARGKKVLKTLQNIT
ncbi:hypothetical protein AAG747_24005 [Rapidithrix thailandica]|uniref:Uncharacterized protein n=1 Tax=Rapidithrix thailandica TaxID=413964 RepID=A0AAW9S1F3_9BACT